MINIAGLKRDKRPQSAWVVHALIDRLEAAESALSNLGVTPDEARDGLARHKALMARLEAAEKERDAAELMSLALRDRIEVTDEVVRELEKKLSTGMWRALRDENEALRAKVNEMERQEPVAEIGQQYTLLFAGRGSITGIVKRHGLKIGDKLYALPGAQPASSIPSTELRPVIEWLRNGCDPMRAADELEMLAAAPEAKP